MDVLKSLVGLGAEDQSVILFEFRMPRMVIAILVGSAFSYVRRDFARFITKSSC